MNKKYNTATLDNGLRIIHLPSSNDIIYCGFAIKAGTRNEQKGEEGLAHFCEHASFKGTQRRRATQIIHTLEDLGGELNAYTNKESTVYYCATQQRNLRKAVDLLADMVFNSVYPEAELEKEKEVVCDEIESYNDSPAELIYDDFENLIFQNHPLGHNILGTKESVRAFSSEDARRFTRRFYRTDNAIFFISGGQDFKLIRQLLEKSTPKEAPAVPIDNAVHEAVPTPLSPSISAEKRATLHQAHVMLGCRAYHINHPRRIALYLLNNILGGPAMSARLNMSLRERNALVYTVESTMASYADTGYWSVYFGCDPHDANRCLRLVRRELDRFIRTPLTERQLQKARQQLKGQIALACDSRESFALDFAKSFLHYGWEKDVTALCAQVDALNPADLQAVAQELFAEENITILRY